MFMLYNENNGAMSIKVKAGDIQESIAYLEESWKKVNPGSTFEYAFLDDQFEISTATSGPFQNVHALYRVGPLYSGIGTVRTVCLHSRAA